jgi:hypothetical protein
VERDRTKGLDAEFLEVFVSQKVAAQADEAEQRGAARGENGPLIPHG